jgi:hypothetical protein
MRGSRPIVVLVAMLAVARIAAGCEEDFKECYAGDYLGCTCENGRTGYAACSAQSDYASSQCVCDGTTPGVDASRPDTGSDAALDASTGDAASCAGDAGDAGRKKLFEPCTAADECEGCRCESFGTKGQLCTISCTSGEQCPAPSDMCTNRGVCRPPQ